MVGLLILGQMYSVNKNLKDIAPDPYTDEDDELAGKILIGMLSAIIGMFIWPFGVTRQVSWMRNNVALAVLFILCCAVIGIGSGTLYMMIGLVWGVYAYVRLLNRMKIKESVSAAPVADEVVIEKTVKNKIRLESGVFTVSFYLNEGQTGEDFDEILTDAILNSDLRKILDNYELAIGE